MGTMNNLRQVGRPNRQKSVIDGLANALKAAVKDPAKRQLLILVDASTEEIGREIFKKHNIVVGRIPPDPQGYWIEDNYDELDVFATVAIVSKSDIDQYTIADRIGFERTVFPDATMIVADFTTSINEGIRYTPTELKSTEAFIDSVAAILNPSLQELPGMATPYSALNNSFRSHEGETTTIAANNAHGKSTLSSTLIGHCLFNERRKVFWASMEMPSNVALARLYASLTRKKINGMSKDCSDRHKGTKNYLTPEEAETCARHIAGKLIIYDVNTGVKSRAILNRVEYARRRFGCSVFVIDSLTKCGIGSQDYQAQKDFLDELTDWARVHNVIVLLIAHLRKGDGKSGDPELKKPTKQDVAGDMGILNLSSNVLLFWRNKAKEKSLDNLRRGIETVTTENIRVKPEPKKYYLCEDTEEQLSESQTASHVAELELLVDGLKRIPDSYIIIAKNRIRGIERDDIGLYYDADHFRFSEMYQQDSCDVYPWLLEPPQQMKFGDK